MKSNNQSILLTIVLSISGAPHDFTVESATGNRRNDDLHITVVASGPTRGGRQQIHIYLGNDGPQGDRTRFDDLRISGQAVVTRVSQGQADPTLSTANYCKDGIWQLPQ